MDNNDFVIAGNAQDILTLTRSDGVFGMPKCVDFMLLSSGTSDVGLLLICFLFRKGASHIMQLPVVPVSSVA